MVEILCNNLRERYIYLLHLCLQENKEGWESRENYKIWAKIKCKTLGRLANTQIY